MGLGSYVLVAVTALSPVGEELIAIPLGVALGIDAWRVALIALSFNYIPVAAISFLFLRLERSERLMRWVGKLRRDRVQRVLDRHGTLGVLLLTPWVGVYTTTVTLELLGMQRRRIHATIVCSLVLYCIAWTLLSQLGVSLWRRWI